MYGDSIADLAQEFGMGGAVYDDVENLCVTSYRTDEEDAGLENIDDLIEQYENSSPSPPERFRASSTRNAYRFTPQFTRNPGPQSSYGYDEITELDADEENSATQRYFQASVHPAAGPSNSPEFDRHPFGGQSASRPSFRPLGPSANVSAHNFRQPVIPNLLSIGNRSSRSAKQVCGEDQSSTRGSNPRNSHGVRLRPVSELPDIYRGMFKFGVFNAVQSSCLDTVTGTDQNMVISAPTGSGKTVLFELAIIRMLMQAGGNAKASKCIYVAPTKALCSEKCRDWTAKFQALGVNCCELTGDTVHFGKSAWGNARDASVIITTGEKWDSLTRNWRDHRQILSQIQLFLVDEVHILNESRGSTLEVIISRMKTRGSSIRFVVVSATVPNIEDVGSWVGDGTPDGSATIMQFGEEFRPCKLSKLVYGIPRKRDQNDFVFQKTLDYRLYAILQQHSSNKPMLVFCSTRKGVLASAEQVMKEYEEAAEKKQALPWARPTRIEHSFQNKRLEKLAACGIGVHHAGMSMDDRRATEDLYIRKLLRIVFATSTLAVGVNLPAHTVIIKGVKIFQNNASQEYSDLDIMQMMGRAGRPQFDKEGVAIIMCETELEAKYKALVQGRTLLESSLHLNLSEHVNSEVGLGTITDLDTAKEWLRKENNQTWQERIDDMVIQSITKLQETQLVTYPEGDDGQICSTDYGDIMSKFYVRQSTMSLILKLPERATVREILEMISNAEEFLDIKIRGGEKQVYNKMRTHNDIRYQVKKVEKPADKIFVLIQAVLGCISLSDPEWKNGDNNPNLEAFSIFRHVSRIAKAVVEVAIVKKAGALLNHGLEVMRCLNAKAWEDRYVVLRQVEHLGEKSLKVLAEYNITTVAALRNQDPLRLEALLNRRPPFGHEVVAAAQQLPQYTLNITEVEVTTHGGKKAVEVELMIECGVVANSSSHKLKKVRNKVFDKTAVLTLTSDLDFIDFRQIPTKALKESKNFTLVTKLTKPSQAIIVCISSETIAGVTVSETYKPNIEAKHYPTMDTRPQNSVDMMLEGLEDDPDFWNVDPDEEDTPLKEEAGSHKTEGPPTRLTSRSQSQKPLEKVGPRAADTTAALQLGFKRLPNGNYECNHACKDKTSCRHLCCHDGVKKPPSMSKRRVEALCADEGSRDKFPKLLGAGSVNVFRDEETSRIKPKAKPQHKPCDKPDARLKHLEALHEQTNVKGNLKLPTGQRIKLDDSNRKVTPKPTLNLSGLGDADLEDSDEDLPEPKELLDAYRTTTLRSSDPSDGTTNYSNSEFDALVRAAPLNDSTQINKLESLPHTTAQFALSPYVKDRINAHPSTRKRKRGSQGPSPAPKRKKPTTSILNYSFKTPPSGSKHDLLLRLSRVAKGKMKEEPLFISLSSDEGDDVNDGFRNVPSQESPARFMEDQDEEMFELDSNLFDIVPDMPTLTNPTASACFSEGPLPSSSQQPMPFESVTSEQRTNASLLVPAASGLAIESKGTKFAYEEDDAEHLGGYQDELDELEAWLQSGAVEIIG